MAYFKGGIQRKCAEQTEKMWTQILDMWSLNDCRILNIMHFMIN